MKSFALAAMSSILMGALLASPAPAEAADGSCGYHSGQYGLNIINLNNSGFDVVVNPTAFGFDGGRDVVYWQATDAQPGDRVMITYGKPNDVPNSPFIGTFPATTGRLFFKGDTS